MPPHVSKSGLAAKYGKELSDAVRGHAKDETTYGIQRLPAGINDGIAHLESCGFGVYKTGDNTGEYFFRAAGVVVEPESVITPQGEVNVSGRQTSVMEPVCDTTDSNGKTTTRDEHIKRIMNTMRVLGGEEFTQNAGSGEDLEELAKSLEERQPYFRFSTSVRKSRMKGKPDGVWENWHGSEGLENYEPGQSVNGQQQVGGDEGGGDQGGDTLSLDQEMIDLVARCDANEEAAIKEIYEKATALGISEDDVSGAADWTAVAFLIMEAEAVAAASGGDEQADANAPPAEEPWEPKVKDVYKYQLVDPKTKKPLLDKNKKVRKPIQVEVTSVDKKGGGSVTIVDSATKKSTFKGVKWDALIRD